MTERNINKTGTNRFALILLSSVAIESEKKKKWLRLFFLAVVKKVMLRLFLLSLYTSLYTN